MLRIVAASAAVLVLAATGAAGGGPLAPGRGPSIEAVPLPPPRPNDAAGEAQDETSPLPPPRPRDLDGHEAAATPRPGEPDAAPCLERLAGLGVGLEPLPAIAEGDCGAAHPFRLKALSGGTSLSGAATVRCGVAEALTRWVTDVVAQEARLRLGASLRGVQLGTSYMCRGRNRQEGTTLSEHAFANAIDVAGFAFDARPTLLVGAAAEGSSEAQFLAEIRQRACMYFTTVLGPGSDPFHDDHLHLDLRSRKGDARLCQ